MFLKNSTAMSAILLLVEILSYITVAQSIGVCYGVHGGNIYHQGKKLWIYTKQMA
ncbi:hypothetical protein GLYMA_11G094902v4 [Glycine max]|nr:hypothetical protein GLYMA_11G094902v4 [Glycine max]KAH1158343.1 hypothetical protein GYH30_030537 [Glycine max]